MKVRTSLLSTKNYIMLMPSHFIFVKFGLQSVREKRALNFALNPSTFAHPVLLCNRFSKMGRSAI